MFDIIHLSLIDVLDILLVGVVIYYVFRLLRGSQAMSIFLAIVALYAIRIVCSALNMKLMSGLLAALLDVGLIALIVIFQPEIRRFLASLGNTYRNAGKKSRVVSRLLGQNRDIQESTESINEICKACEEMSKEKCGALIVIKRKNPLEYIEDTGDVIDAHISQRLIRNLFFKNSPLHDGAVVIEGDRIAAARCTLPITEQKVPASFGMRHKAAVGISETTDVLVIVVSEETGHISVVQEGQATVVENINDLKRMLQNG